MPAEKPRKIAIEIADVHLEAQLNDSRTAGRIWEALPFSSTSDFWGEELYFSIPVRCELENPIDVVEPGTIAYWPPGSAFCIFWGATPVSRGGECRAASAVNPFGKILSSLAPLRRLKGRPLVRVRRLEPQTS